MSRPLLITDCDEVLLHMVVPFAEWLDEAHHIHFDVDSGDFVNALRHKATGLALGHEEIWPLLRGFRGKPAGDVAALVDAVMAVADYAQANAHCLLELDVNPVLVMPQGVLAVDALIRLQGDAHA